MTQKRRDGHGTGYGDWLREQPEIDSKLGYVCSNIDYLWKHRSGLWLLKEEKRHGWMPKFYQASMFKLLDRAIRLGEDRRYRGFHILIFENTTPDDGQIFLDGKFISRDDLVSFLIFNKPAEWYASWFPENDNRLMFPADADAEDAHRRASPVDGWGL